jgi:ureidoglycolate hydrolase
MDKKVTAKKVTVKKLTVEAFHMYGSFANMTEPSGPKLGFGPVEFYRDMAILSLGQIGEAACRKERMLSMRWNATTIPAKPVCRWTATS